ncbi:MAG: selenocysteine-specific translation elongation factor [Eubacteriales bacterium]|nr:selenocysteine-specific translation elongation factor [Eubacteriales bacterium]MDD4323679.1 selenocysteine-specific translation elongation factor [Eubacteriales bacterium]MDD4540659.1 selenocysteine-specific translation elongation factor [Eubacteriales bacterium]
MSNNVIIGTAGHVDHGKTSLISALTKIDTDRLREEKARGITIELGFAYLDLPDGGRAGIIDVPGHERFVSNMLAGAGGIDIALLVVAADEGVMPQTLEHLGILQLLGIKQGVIALTKIDLVDEEWRELAEEDLREHIAGTFLENAPIFHVSSTNGEGIAELRQTLIDAVEAADQKKVSVPFRLPIDRVFTLSGIGTVVTGTLIEGKLSSGDDVVLYPQEKKVRVRSVQVHDEAVDEARAGQRVAVNLSGTKKDEVERGNILAESGSLLPTYILDVDLRSLKHSRFQIENGMRVHLYHGSRELLARVVLLDRDILEKGDTASAQLRLEEQTYIKQGDHFVVRFYSPVETIGGGIILDPIANKRKRYSDLDDFELMRSEDATARLDRALKSSALRFKPLNEIYYRAGIQVADGKKYLQPLIESGRAVQLNEQTVLHISGMKLLSEKCRDILQKFHEALPLELGMKRESLRTRLLPRASIQVSDRVIDELVNLGYVEDRDGEIALKGHSADLSPREQQLIDELSSRYEAEAFSPSATDELIAEYNKDDKIDQILSRMVNDGILIRLTEQILMHHSIVEKALKQVKKDIDERGSVTLADFRDETGTTRKFAIAILEHFDRLKLTKLVGDSRILLGD